MTRRCGRTSAVAALVSGLCGRLGGQRGLGPLCQVLSSADFKGLARKQIVPGVLQIALLTLLCQVWADAETAPGRTGPQRWGRLPCGRVLCTLKGLQQPAAAVLERRLGRWRACSQLNCLQRFTQAGTMRSCNRWHARPRFAQTLCTQSCLISMPSKT